MGKGNPKPANGFDKRPQDINRNGAPKKEWTWAGTIRRVVEQMEEVEGKKVKENVAKSLLNQCLQGNMQAIKEFGDRVDGKAPQSIGRFNDDGEFEEQSLQVVIVDGKD